MNYRHSFHAGNFADLHKHAVLLLLLKALRPEKAALAVIDTHAGAGIYDLGNDDQARSKEASVWSIASTLRFTIMAPLSP